MKISLIISSVNEVSVVIHLSNSRKNSTMSKFMIILLGAILMVQIVVAHGGGGGAGGQGNGMRF